ncbi:MAG: hypothetical protein ACK4VY_11005 [Brevundimonas sp.]
MATTLTRLFDSHTQALDAVSDLEAAGVDSDRISLVSNNADDWHAGHKHPHENLSDDSHGEVAEGIGKGAATGGALGAGAGVLAGLGMLAIPGLGPVVAAGWLASTAVGAAVGAAAGGATGGILGALKDAGHSDEDAHVYAEGVRRGGTLVSVKADEADATRLQAILDGRNGFDAASRGAAYRETGWSAFDPEAPAYSTDQIAQERARYR